MVILARIPFQPMEIPDDRPKRDLTKGNFNIENSIRVGIVVQSEDK